MIFIQNKNNNNDNKRTRVNFYPEKGKKNEQNINYLCMQKEGSRYLKPRSGPREQPVTNLMKNHDPILYFWISVLLYAN